MLTTVLQDSPLDRAGSQGRLLLDGIVGAANVTFVVKGLGERKPVAPNLKKDGTDNPRGRALSRRVEVQFSKSD